MLWPDLAKAAREFRAAHSHVLMREQRKRWEKDPVIFHDEVFGSKAWSRQREFLYAMRDNDRVACSAGHKLSKSRSLAAFGMWWCEFVPGGKVVTTATTAGQIRDVIWDEVHNLWRAANDVGKLALPEPAFQPRLGMRWPNGSRFYGLTADSKEGMAGVSGPKVVWLVDEATGISEAIFEAIKGNLAGGAKLVLSSNPTQDSGSFFDAFNDHAELYYLMTISAHESPNVAHVDDDGAVSVPDDELIPGVATADYINASRIDYGPDWKTSPLYAVRVLGEFAKQSEMSVVGSGLVMMGVANWPKAEAEGVLNLGIDVAHGGADETDIRPLRGHKALIGKTVNGYVEQRTACLVVDVLWEHYEFGEPHVQIKIDTGGGYGTELVARLRDPEDKCWTHEWVECDDGSHVWVKRRGTPPWGTIDPPVDLFEVNGSCSSTVISPDTGEPEYANLRSQMWFGITDWLKAGGTIPDDRRLAQELVAPRYEVKKNKRAVEEKKQIKKRLKRSPDRGDALALAIYQPEPLGVEGSSATVDYPDEWGAGRGYG